MLNSQFLWKVWGSMALFLALSSLIFGYFIGNEVQKDTYERIERDLSQQANLLIPTLAEQLAEVNVLTPDVLKQLVPGVTARITLINYDGAVLGDSESLPSLMDNHLDRPELISAKNQSFGTARRFSQTLNQDMIYVAVKMETRGGKIGFLRLALPLTVVNMQIQSLRNKIFIGGGLIGLGLLLISYYLAYRVLSPLTKVTKRAYAIAQEQYHVRLPTKRFDVGQLSEIINEFALGGQQRIDELTKSRNYLAAVLSGLTEGVLAFDLEQKVLHVNEAALRMLSLNVEQVLNKTFFELPVSRQFKAVVEKCLIERKSDKATVRFGDQTFECSCLQMTSSGSESAGGIMVLEDITEKMHLEKVRSDFVANASHELKTPISAIRGLAETIIDDSKMPDDVFSRFITRIKSQAIHLDSIVQDLLHLSKFDSSDPEKNARRLDLADLARKVYVDKSYEAGDAGLKFDLKIESEPLEIDGDAEALNQLFANLVDNAIKYNRVGGTVEMKLSKRGLIGLVQIEDTGIGISSDEKERIFERFYRVDKARAKAAAGTGLGLAIVKHIAQAHKGSVTVDSQLEKGSVFSVNIPLAEQNF